MHTEFGGRCKQIHSNMTSQCMPRFASNVGCMLATLDVNLRSGDIMNLFSARCALCWDRLLTARCLLLVGFECADVDLHEEWVCVPSASSWLKENDCWLVSLQWSCKDHLAASYWATRARCVLVEVVMFAQSRLQTLPGFVRV